MLVLCELILFITETENGRIISPTQCAGFQANAMLTIGQTLQNRYYINAVLGQGGMGAVYRAYDKRLNRAYVVKEMLISSSDTANNLAETSRQFQKDAEVLAG